MKTTLGITSFFALWFIIQWLSEVLAPYATPIGIGLLVVIFLGIVKVVNAVLK